MKALSGVLLFVAVGLIQADTVVTRSVDYSFTLADTQSGKLLDSFTFSVPDYIHDQQTNSLRFDQLKSYTTQPGYSVVNVSLGSLYETAQQSYTGVARNLIEVSEALYGYDGYSRSFSVEIEGDAGKDGVYSTYESNMPYVGNAIATVTVHDPVVVDSVAPEPSSLLLLAIGLLPLTLVSRKLALARRK